MKKEFDFIAIGDIVTDAFIRLSNAEVHCNINKNACELCVEFGSKIPYESVTVVSAVGNCANAAVAAARLGLRTALVANQGMDDTGKEHLKVMKREKVATDFIRSHWNTKTNYHYVLWFGDERTILVKHEKYPYSLPNIGNPKWLYLTSLGAETLAFHDEIALYLKSHPTVKLAFQPGTFQISQGKKKLKYFYERSEVFVCNLQEAQKITGEESDKPEILLSALRALGPKIVILTDGPKGAFLSTGDSAWFMPPYPDKKPPYERTGAGDSFASTFVSAMALGLSPEEALAWAPINSMSVVQKIGAQAGLLKRAELEDYLENAPRSYRPIKLKTTKIS